MEDFLETFEFSSESEVQGQEAEDDKVVASVCRRCCFPDCACSNDDFFGRLEAINDFGLEKEDKAVKTEEESNHSNFFESSDSFNEVVKTDWNSDISFKTLIHVTETFLSPWHC